MLGDLAVTNPTQRAEHIGRHDQRASLTQRLDMVCGEWVAGVAVALSAQFAVGNLLALLDAEPPPVGVAVRRWSAILRPLGRLAWSTDIAAVAVGGQHSAGQTWSLRPHALGNAGSDR
jgi:hypothetical protein